MNRDPETSLSAFLDDELAPADRADLAWSIESSPALARELRGLADARDAVASLSRPTPPVDVSAQVLARLDGVTLRRVQRRRWARRMRETAAIGGVVAMAASLFGAMFFVYRATHPERARVVIPPLAQLRVPLARQPAPPAIPAPAPEALAASAANAERAADPVLADAPQPPMLARLGGSPGQAQPRLRGQGGQPKLDAQPRTQAQARNAPAELTLAKAPGANSAERDQLKGMLQRPDVHRILIVTDVIDAGERIKTLIQRDPRKNPNFARVTVTGGVVIDPRHPGDADVFTVILDGRESERLLGQIDRTFPETDVVVDPRPDPAMLAQLTQVGRVAVLPGLKAETADLPLVVAMEELPTRPTTRAERGRSLDAVERFSKRFDEPGLVANDREADRTRETLPPRFPPTPGPATYLVWVTRPVVRR